jgi:predicted nuclease of restriction endonuclease-like (RecB) superfamily
MSATQRRRSQPRLTRNLKITPELGVGWAFVASEVPLQCGDREFFLDLLFYHCVLRRYVVIELKLGRFEPEHVPSPPRKASWKR